MIRLRILTPYGASGRQASSGFTIIEMIIAMALTIAVIGAVFQLVNPAQRTFQAQPEVSDLQQRLRVGVDTLVRDLLMAGAGPQTGSPVGALNYSFAPVMPYRRGDRNDDPGKSVFYRPDTISLVSIPATPAQTTIRPPAAGEAPVLRVSELLVNAQPHCSKTDPLCGFAAGTHAIIADRFGSWDPVTISDVRNATLRLGFRGALTASYDAGSYVAQAAMDTYYLRTDPATNTFQLMHYDGIQTDLPVVDHVVKMAFTYFGESAPPALLPNKPLSDTTGPWTTYGPRPPALDQDNADDVWGPGENCTFQVDQGRQVPRLATLGARGEQVLLTETMLTDGPWCPDVARQDRFDADLLRVRRVRVTLRVQVAAAALRGPAGLLFTRGGTSTSGEHYVPDQEIRFDIAPRNMNLGR